MRSFLKYTGMIVTVITKEELIMAFNLRNRSFLTLADFNTREMEYMLNLAEDLKKAKYAGYEGKNLEGKNIALIFE